MTNALPTPKNKIISLNIRGSMFFMIQLISQFCLMLRVGTGQTTSYHISQYEPCELTQTFLARRNFEQICGDETGVFRDNRVDTQIITSHHHITYHMTSHHTYHTTPHRLRRLDSFDHIVSRKHGIDTIGSWVTFFQETGYKYPCYFTVQELL